MSALRIERLPIAGATEATGAATRRSSSGYQWVIYSGAVAVLRCEAEADARALLEMLRVRRAAEVAA